MGGYSFAAPEKFENALSRILMRKFMMKFRGNFEVYQDEEIFKLIVTSVRCIEKDLDSKIDSCSINEE